MDVGTLRTIMAKRRFRLSSTGNGEAVLATFYKCPVAV